MRGRRLVAGSLAVLLVGLVIAPVLVGYEPLGADPDLMYRPIKHILAQSLLHGKIPFWSDALGLGLPLVAESHAAAFYPPNWPLFRFLDVNIAYRLSLWVHSIFAVVATYLYARTLCLDRWGSAMAGVAFALCGFQASHSGHEPLYTALPFLPLCLIFADRFARTGRPAWAASLALGWGVQITIGHFQIPMWTGVLAIVCGLWRIRVDGPPRRRAIGLVIALAGGLAVAAPQLGLTWELTRVAGFARSYDQLANFAFPPSHANQPALPWLFARTYGPDGDRYWGLLGTSAGESSFYFGTIPFVLAWVGMCADRSRSPLAIWKWLIAASLALASMSRWWPFGYWLATCVPGLGWFRCPGRDTIIATLGLAIFAGRGLDRTISSSRFRVGMILAILAGAASLAWSVFSLRNPMFRACLGDRTITLRMGVTAGSWILAIVMISLWRIGRIAPWSLVVLTTIELAALYHMGPVSWGRDVPDPAASPILQRLANEPGVGLVAGPLKNLPARVGLTTAYPYLGITPPPPNYLLEGTQLAGSSGDAGVQPWMSRFGVTHGVWHEHDIVPRAETLFVAADPILDRLLTPDAPPSSQPRWKIVSYRDASPPAWVSPSATTAPAWEDLYPLLVRSVNRDEAIYLVDDAPPVPKSRWATEARVVTWDGWTAVVVHDGACDLVIRRTFYPGWSAQINNLAPSRIFKANGGLQAVRIDGSGTSRVTFSYQPSALRAGTTIALAAIVGCVAVLAVGVTRRSRPFEKKSVSVPSDRA